MTGTSASGFSAVVGVSSQLRRSMPGSDFGAEVAVPFDTGGAGSANCSKGDWSLVLLQNRSHAKRG